MAKTTTQMFGNIGLTTLRDRAEDQRKNGGHPEEIKRGLLDLETAADHLRYLLRKAGK